MLYDHTRGANRKIASEGSTLCERYPISKSSDVANTLAYALRGDRKPTASHGAAPSVPSLPSPSCRHGRIPFADEVEQFTREHETVYVVEINRDGQLRQLLTIEYPKMAARLQMAAHMDGMPLSARWIRDEILSQAKEK